MSFARKIVIDGVTWDSTPEYIFYTKLVKFKERGKIKDFSVKNTYLLQEAFSITYQDIEFKERMIEYNPDFLVELNNGDKILIDVKGGGASEVEPDAALKRKIFMYQNDLPLFFISQIPIYLGGNKETFVEVTPTRDFLTKLKNKYIKLYPNSKGKRTKEISWKPKNWEEYFTFDSMDGLFYYWKETKRKKLK